MPTITGANRKQAGAYYDWGGKTFHALHPNSGMKGDSATDDRAAFDTLVNTTMQAANVPRVVDVVGIIRIASALSIPSNVRLNFASGSYLAPDVGVTVTINGPVNHHLEKKFGGGGSVVFGGRKVKVAHPEWWGASDDARVIGDGSIIGGTAAFSSSVAGFTAADAGKAIVIIGAGAAVAGTGTVTAAAGAATFSSTQAGKIRNGSTIVVAGVSYLISAFNGTTGATLSGAPTFGATAFTIGTNLATTILAYVNSTNVTLAVNASTTVNAVSFTYGTNNTPFHQAAINSNVKHVHSPGGSYMLSQLTLVANQKFSGAGAGATTFYKHQVTGASGLLYADSLSSSAYVDNIHLSGFRIDLQVGQKGYAQFEHAISLHGVRRPLIERVEIIGIQGDGIYIGSGPGAGAERHNEDVTIRKFLIDGLVADCRNGISVIDVDGLTVTDGRIQNVGNALLSSSVGGMDFEPNDTWNVYRDILVQRVKFKNISSVNTAGITFFTGLSSGVQLVNYSVSHCSFESCYYGVQAGSLNKTSAGSIDGLSVTYSKFVNSINFDIILTGLKGYTLQGNTHIVDPEGSTSYRGSISLGKKNSGTALCEHAHNGKVVGNAFKGLRPQFAVIWVLGARGLEIRSNDFDNIVGSCIQFSSAATAGTRRYLDRIIIEKNHVHNEEKFTLTAPVTVRFINADAGINAGNDNCWINSTNIERNNQLDHGVTRIVGGVNIIFCEEIRAAAATTGTWDKANFTRRATPAAGTVGDATSVAGTAGTLAGVTADATNGSVQLLNVADPNDSLREGQWIKVNAEATARKILAYVGTTIWLDTAYAGVTGAGVAVAWAGAATWVAV